MKKRKRLISILSIIIGIILIVGIWAAAESNYGSQSDPLITLSYITDVLTGQITERLNTQMDSKLATHRNELDNKISELEEQAGNQGSSKRFKVVSLSNGQTLTGSVGTELMLRVGSAVCRASASPGLIDTTTSGVLDDGGSLEKNHMYMVTIEGRGIKATSSNVLVLVRGDYTIT